MNEKLQKTLENIVPFFLIGIAVALVIGLFIMFSYVLVWGIIIGGFLWAGNFVKNLFFSHKSPPVTTKKRGRVIEHEDRD